MPFSQLFERHQGRTAHKLLSYGEVYDRHFDRYTAAGPPILVMEIGIGLGGSLQLWREYFGSRAQIIGLDIRPECKQYEEEQIAVRIGDQSNTAFLASVIEEFGRPDIVIDDGSHIGKDQKASFDFLYPKIAADGIYLVEDIHCSYLRHFDGGVREPGTFMEACKTMLDWLNGVWWQEENPHAWFADITRSMHFYDSIAVFERGHLETPRLSQKRPPP